MRTTVRTSATRAGGPEWEVGMPDTGAAAGAWGGIGDDPRAWTPDQAVTVLHAAHYRGLVRTAALLLHRTDLAEEVVQDAFVGLHRRWGRLRDPERAVAYLRQSTVNGARSAGRRMATAQRKQPALEAGLTAVPDPAGGVAERESVLQALATLPQRQREVLVLRYYADLSEAAIAEALGISPGTVKAHASRGLAALRPTLEQVR
jgi:RNA polymerase sigma-70 factor (sigma-E family)